MKLFVCIFCWLLFLFFSDILAFLAMIWLCMRAAASCTLQISYGYKWFSLVRCNTLIISIYIEWTWLWMCFRLRVVYGTHVYRMSISALNKVHIIHFASIQMSLGETIAIPHDQTHLFINIYIEGKAQTHISYVCGQLHFSMLSSMQRNFIHTHIHEHPYNTHLRINSNVSVWAELTVCMDSQFSVYKWKSISCWLLDCVLDVACNVPPCA